MFIYNAIINEKVLSAKASIRYYEYREIDRTVGTVLSETGQTAEIVMLVMFDDENSAGPEHLRRQHALGHRSEIGHVVGRIGKDHVELLDTSVDKSEGIALDEVEILNVELLGDFTDKIILCRRLLDRRHIGAFAKRSRAERPSKST